MNTTNFIQGPALDTESFTGRVHEIAEIANFLCRNQSISIIGPQKIGKSSLMLHLTRSKILKTMETGEDNQCVYIDCSRHSNLRQTEILTCLRNEVAAQVNNSRHGPKPALDLSHNALTWSGFELVLRSLCQLGMRVIFLLDDVECLMMNPNLETSFFNALRSLASRLRVVYLTASEKQLIDLTSLNNQAKLLSSPFFNIFAQVYLGPFPEDEANNLIEGSFRSAGIELSSQTQDFIYQLVGGHPFALQVACACAFDNPGDFKSIEQRTWLALERLFQDYWDTLTITERDVLRHVEKIDFHKPIDPKLNSILRSLTQKCLLVQEETSYIYPSKIWEKYITMM